MHHKRLRRSEIKELLDEKVDLYNRPSFIEDDPISIPHEFKKKQDIEIAGFFAAILAWGKRKIIINKCKDLLGRMDNDPYNFVRHHSEADLKNLLTFKHRTFNDVDALYFVSFLHWFYQQHSSLEEAFVSKDRTAEHSLIKFHNLFFSLEDHPPRTRKHIPTPLRKSTCKRLNMYLRWMVRCDDKGVDFGLWKKISPAMLVCPCDLHVDRVARKLRLITRNQTDWLTAIELTENLKGFDPEDPVRYDFALFGLGVVEGWV